MLELLRIAKKNKNFGVNIQQLYEPLKQVDAL